MYAIVEIGGAEAVLNQSWKWSSSDRHLEEVLNKMTDSTGPSASDPRPYATEAERVTQLLGGRVLMSKREKHVEGLIY